MPIQIQIRRGLSTQWLEANSTLANGEIGYETDSGFFKIGTGVTAWANLKYTVSNTALFANNASYLNGNSAQTLLTYTDNKSGNAYSNAVTYVDTRIGVVNTAITSNAATAYSNAVDTALTGAIFYTDYSIGFVNTAITSNAATAYTNAITFSANATNLTNGTIPYGRFPANIVNTSANFTISGVHTYNANLVISTTAGISANGSYGTQGQALLSNGSSVYWATATAGTNTQIQFNDSNTANASAGFTFDKVSNTVTIGNSVVNATINSTAYSGSASYVGGNTALTLRTYTDDKAANAYSNATTFAANATNITNGTLSEPRLPYRMDQNVRTTDSVNFSSLTLSGNLTVNGGVVVVSGNSVTFTDNMLYLNQGVSANVSNISSNGTYVIFTANNNYSPGWDVSVTGVNPSSFNGNYDNIFAANSTTFTVANTNIASYVSGGVARGKSDSNPDIGIAAGYNDGTYHHAGFFRDHSSGVWKVFDNYAPEPDSSIFLDQSNNSFHIADFQANTIYVGNTSVYATINSTFFNATSNNTSFVGSISAANVVSNLQLSGNLANYQTTAGLAANVATLTSNNTSFVGSVSAINVVSNAQLSSNLANYVTTTNLTNNLANYQTTAGLAANVVKLTANLANYIIANTGVISNSSGVFIDSSYIATLTANGAITANNSLYLGGIIASGYQTTAGLAANVATLTANNTSFVGTVSAANVVSNAQLSGNLTNYQTTAGLAANVATLTANNSSFIGTVSAANVVSNAQLSANLSSYQTTAGLAANVAILTANNSTYLNGQLATYYTNATNITSGTLPYAQIPANVVNTTAAFTISNVFTYNANLVIGATGELVFNTNAGIYANGSLGTANQVLTSNGTTVYWANAGGGFTNGQSISVNNFVVTGSITANSSNGTAGQILTSNGSAVYWSAPAAAVSAANATSQSFTGNGSNTIFTLSASVANQRNAIVSMNGLLQVPVTHYTISGTTLTFTDAPYNGAVIEVRSIEGVALVSGGSGGGSGGYTRTSIVATGGQTSFAATYTVGNVLVFVNGALLHGDDYTATSGTSVVLTEAASAIDIVDIITISGGSSISSGDLFIGSMLLGGM